MLTKTITYEDFNGNMVTEECQFHLTKSELMKMELGESGGMYNALERMISEKDTKKLIEYFDKFIKASYGKKSEDGKRFIKNSEIAEEFSQGLAYDQLVFELLSNPEEAAAFFQGILPKELSSQISQEKIDEAKEQALEMLSGPEKIKEAASDFVNADNNNT